MQRLPHPTSGPSSSELRGMLSETPEGSRGSLGGTAAGDASPRAPRPPRLSGIDAGRMLATLGVIWVHVAEMQGHPPTTTAWGRFGTSFYVAALALFATRAALADPTRTPRDELRRGARRLLAPYAAWCLVYALFYGRHAWSAGIGLAALTEWWGPLAGTARHLWFLPFAWAGAALVNWVVGRARRLETRALGRVTACVGVASYLACYGVIFFFLPRGLLLRAHLHRVDRWVEELPLLLTVACASLWLVRRGPPARSLRLATSCAGAFLLLELVYGRWVLHFQETTRHLDARYLSHAAGLALLATCLALPEGRVLRALARLRHVTYFTFLAHLLLLESVGGRLYNTPGFGSVPFALATTVALFTVASLLGVVVRRIPGLRLLAGAS